MNHRGNDGMDLWDERDGFFYDVLKFPDGSKYPMRVRSMVGLLPLFAVDDRIGNCWTACPASSGDCSGSSTTGLIW